MEILSLITHFEHIPTWLESVHTITRVDKKWNQRKMWSKAWFVAKQVDVYDSIVIFYDIRFALVLSIFMKIVFWKNKKARIIFTTYLCDISFFSQGKKIGFFLFDYNKIRFLLHKFILNSVDRVVVHSSAEIQMYSDCFRLPLTKFVFIHYCVRADALGREMELRKDDYLIVAGRHRDYATFIEAVSGLKIKGIIIAGNSDRSLIPTELSGNVGVQYEVPFPRYREMIAHSKGLVVPLSRTRMLRSLGQVTIFEAVAMKVPIIASRTFQLSDYFQEDKEILFFETGNVIDLQKKMELIISDPVLVQKLTTNAYQRMMQSYTDKQYTEKLIALCSNRPLA